MSTNYLAFWTLETASQQQVLKQAPSFSNVFRGSSSQPVKTASHLDQHHASPSPTFLIFNDMANPPISLNANGSSSRPNPSQHSSTTSISAPFSATKPSTGDPGKSRFGVDSTMSLLVESLKDRLLLAVPKKGRLHEKCLDLLAGADIKYNRAHRLDVALVQNHPIALVFLPAADIPRFVALGSVSLGITGQDVIAESTHAEDITQLLPLGFGKCALQVQVPVSGPVQSVEGLSGGRIATSFDGLAGEFFKQVDDKQGKAEGQRTKIEYVGGSVEAACALGMADGIVDLVESGDTMRAAGLHAIHTLMTSEAVLITPRVPHQSDHPSLAPIIPLIKSRFAGVLAAKKYVYASYNIKRAQLAAALSITPGRRAPTVSPLDEDGWVAVSAMVERKKVAEVMDELEAAGAEDILILALDNCRVGV